MTCECIIKDLRRQLEDKEKVIEKLVKMVDFEVEECEICNFYCRAEDNQFCAQCKCVLCSECCEHRSEEEEL